MKVTYKSLEVPMPCIFHSCSPQAKAWDKTHTMLIAIFENGEIYYRLPKHQVGVLNPKVKPSKWEPLNKRSDISGAIECVLPKGIKAPNRSKFSLGTK